MDAASNLGQLFTPLCHFPLLIALFYVGFTRVHYLLSKHGSDLWRVPLPPGGCLLLPG